MGCYSIEDYQHAEHGIFWLQGGFFLFVHGFYASASNFLKYPRRNGFSSSAVVPLVVNFCRVVYASNSDVDTSASGIRR